MKTIDYNEYKNLKIVNVFEFYDKPLYYIAKSSNEDYFLFYFIDDSSEVGSEWFVSQITKNEINKIMNQQIGALDFLNFLLNKNRLGRFCISYSDNNKIETSLTAVSKYNLELDEFPDENFMAEYDYINDKELTYVAPVNNLIEKFKLVLKDANNSHNVSLNFLMQNLSNVSKSVNSFHRDNIKSEFGKSEQVDNSLGIDVLAFQPSSFGIWFEVKKNDHSDLFNVGAKSVDTFFSVIETINKKSDKEIYEDVFIEEKYSLESLKIVNTYLKEIKDKDYSFSLEAYTNPEVDSEPDIKVTFNKDTYHNLKKIDSLLESESNELNEEIDVSGTLTSVNTKRNGFWLSIDEGSDHKGIEDSDIKGIFETNLFRKIKNAGENSIQVPSKVKATLIKKTINNHLTDEYTTKYSLKSYTYN